MSINNYAKGVKKLKARHKNRKKAPAKEEFLGLPTEQTVPTSSLSGYSWFIYGEKKIGKTTLASQFPKSFFMMFEPGGKALKLWSRNVDNWTHAKYLVKALKKDRKFETVVIDVADVMADMCMVYICKKLVIDHPSDEAWGKGWDAYRKEFTGFVHSLLALPDKGIVFISHAKEANIKSRMGEEWNKMAPTMKPMPAEVLNGLCDILAFYHYNGERRFLTIHGNDFITAGHRLNDAELGIEAFTWKGKPVRHIHMGAKPSEGYKNVVDCFNNKYEPVPYKTGGTEKKKTKKKKTYKGV